MKLLIMCEGPNELEIVRILLENNCLKFIPPFIPPFRWRDKWRDFYLLSVKY